MRVYEPNSLAVRIDFDQRAALFVEGPDIYYVADHHLPYPLVLGRMSRIGRKALKDLLKTGWRFVTDRKDKARVAGRSVLRTRSSNRKGK